MATYVPTPEETTGEKNRLIKIVQPELKEHGLVHLTDFVNNFSREGFKHPGFVRSLAYRIEELGIGEVLTFGEHNQYYIKRNIFSKRQPYWYAVRIGAIGVLFSILAGISIAITQVIIRDRLNQEQLQQLAPTAKVLYDSVAGLRHDLQIVEDSLMKRK